MVARKFGQRVGCGGFFLAASCVSILTEFYRRTREFGNIAPLTYLFEVLKCFAAAQTK